MWNIHSDKPAEMSLIPLPLSPLKPGICVGSKPIFGEIYKLGICGIWIKFIKMHKRKWIKWSI